jgi:hypothetical protein
MVVVFAQRRGAQYEYRLNVRQRQVITPCPGLHKGTLYDPNSSILLA